MSWKFWKKDTPVKTYSQRSIEAYVITSLGLERLGREHSPTLTYEGAKILWALRKGKCTIGELVDVCSHLYAPALTRELGKLVELGLIKQEDVVSKIRIVQ